MCFNLLFRIRNYHSYLLYVNTHVTHLTWFKDTRICVKDVSCSGYFRFTLQIHSSHYTSLLCTLKAHLQEPQLLAES